MARRMKGCMADLVVRWTDILMALGWMTDWIDIFINGWMIRCFLWLKGWTMST